MGHLENMNIIKIKSRIQEPSTVLHQASFGLLVIKVEPSAKIREGRGMTQQNHGGGRGPWPSLGEL